MARLHARGIHEGFLATLGEPFLTLLYEAMASSDRAVLLVARTGTGAVAGFVAGAAHPGAFYREFLLRRGVRAAARLAPRAVRPQVARRIWETLRHLGAEGGGGPELLSIAVGDRGRRSGTGTALARGLEDALGAGGASRLVVVVAERNAPARAFYERLGFRPARTLEVHRGERSIRYEKPL
ncbi:MAG TPA: GNAT family N-acetyltransferase [Actinomycetota bacterium]|nr:GNAT family N-acetyltransferase [Actinomycetota bacterium]